MVTKGGCAGWFGQRTNLEKTLISVSCLLLLTLVLLILVGIAFKGNSSADPDSNEKPGCWSTECLKTTGHIVSLMDERWDPCSNFYDYACGGFSQSLGHSVAQNSIDSVYYAVKDLLESSSTTSTDEMDSLKSFYKTCLDFEGIYSKGDDRTRIFLDLMSKYDLGSWPVLDNFYSNSDDSIYKNSQVLSALTMLGVPVAFRVEVVPDNQIEGSYRLKIYPGSAYESGRLGAEIRRDEDLKMYIILSYFLLGSKADIKVNAALDDVVSLEAYFANVDQEWKTKRQCDPVDIIAPDESLKDLNTVIPEMNWTVLFSSIQEQAGVNRPFAVEVHCKTKIREYLVHLKDQVERVSQNYFIWRFFQFFVNHIEPRLRRTQINDTDDVPRWKQCAMLIEKYAAPSLARGLSTQRINKEIEDKVQEINTSFRSAMEELVSKNRWLKQEKKSKILRQIQSVEFKLPYDPKDATRSVKEIAFPQVDEDGYTAAVVELRRQSIIRSFKKLNPSYQAEESSDSGKTMLTSDSHVPTESSLPLYFDKIQEPFLWLQGPNGLNYGSFGTFLAREFSEIALPEDIGFSSEDHTSIWNQWTKNDSGCVPNLFSERYRFNSETEIEKYVKDLFLEIGSLEIALESARRGMKSKKTDLLPGFERSDEQMFFIAYAQTQCEAKRSEVDSSYFTNKERVNTIVSNSKEFAEAFTCSSSPSSSKCHIWT